MTRVPGLWSEAPTASLQLRDSDKASYTWKAGAHRTHRTHSYSCLMRAPQPKFSLRVTQGYTLQVETFRSQKVQKLLVIVLFACLLDTFRHFRLLASFSGLNSASESGARRLQASAARRQPGRLDDDVREAGDLGRVGRPKNGAFGSWEGLVKRTCPRVSGSTYGSVAAWCGGYDKNSSQTRVPPTCLLSNVLGAYFSCDSQASSCAICKDELLCRTGRSALDVLWIATTSKS